MSDKHIYDQHVVDYIAFNNEQNEWFDEVEKKQMIDNTEWIMDYLKDFPIELEYKEPPV